MLRRLLESEVMDSPSMVRAYDRFNRRDTVQRFVDDLLRACTTRYCEHLDVLDVGTGNAEIPCEICDRTQRCRVLAADLSFEMLEMARYRIEIAGLIDRIQLDRADAKQLPYADLMFDVVISNTVVHHIADPAGMLSELVRVTADGGVLFVRDYLRPPAGESLESRVAEYDANEEQRAMIRQALGAALRLDEIRSILEDIGLPAERARSTHERYWTWSIRKG